MTNLINRIKKKHCHGATKKSCTHILVPACALAYAFAMCIPCMLPTPFYQTNVSVCCLFYYVMPCSLLQVRWLVQSLASRQSKWRGHTIHAFLREAAIVIGGRPFVIAVGPLNMYTQSMYMICKVCMYYTFSRPQKTKHT